MKNVLAILFAVFLMLIMCGLSQARHEFHPHRHTQCTRLSMHRPLPIKRQPYDKRLTNPPKRHQKPFIDLSLPTPMPGKIAYPHIHIPRNFVDENSENR